MTELDSGKKGKNSDVMTHNPSDTQSLTDEHCMIALPRVKGFAIKSKDWYKFNVVDVSDATWNDHVLGNLVLAKAEKEMLLALISHTARSEDEGFDDFLEGKGT